MIIKLFLYCALTFHVIGNGEAIIENSIESNSESDSDYWMHPDLFTSKRYSFSMLDELETTEKYWRNLARDFLLDKQYNQPNRNRAKNIILFLGDGMGLTTIAAARNLLGGIEKRLSFEYFPYTGLVKTYSVDKIVPDSACTATAYLCGIKAQMGTIGVTGAVDESDCEKGSQSEYFVDSIAKWAMDAGKSAGLVTTTRVTHASPAGVYAHIAQRDWENDAEVKKACGPNTTIKDIAYQLIYGDTGKNLKLILGGGRKYFVQARNDSINLIDAFLNENPHNIFIDTREDLLRANLLPANRILGLFQDSHLLYHLETNETTNQPTLEEMTQRAIEYLSLNDEGYFLFIEGGRIDTAHHDNMARIALDETIEFSKAIAKAVQMTNSDETLIIVTADHSHAFSYAGYPHRKDDVFAPIYTEKNLDKKAYMALSYSSGPSFDRHFDSKTGQRRNPADIITGDKYDQFPSTWPLAWETHGGDDVPVYASGPWSHLFTGNYEQNDLPHLMGYAACLGDGLKMCDTRPKS